MKTCLFDIILNRVSKECEFYHGINRTYDKNELVEFVKKRIEDDDPLNIEEIFVKCKILSNRIRLYEQDKYYDFVNQINKIIYLFIQNEIINFLKINCAFFNFVSNLKELRQIGYSSSDINPNNIDEYIEYLIEKDITPFDFIVYAFEWRYTPQGFTHWNDLDIKYRKFLTEKLFNIKYHE